MAKKHGRGKMKPYASPGHVHDHAVHDLPDPSGGLMAGATPMGGPQAPGAGMGQPPMEGM